MGFIYGPVVWYRAGLVNNTVQIALVAFANVFVVGIARALIAGYKARRARSSSGSDSGPSYAVERIGHAPPKRIAGPGHEIASRSLPPP